MLTYGDGVADINVTALVSYHKAHGKLATVTSTSAVRRFGALICDGVNRVTSFPGKARRGTGSWINGGFFVLRARNL